MMRLLHGLAVSALGASVACACSSGRGAPAPTNTRHDPEGDAELQNAAAPARLPRDPPYRDFDINHVLSTGQSNAVAIDATPPITTTQPYANLKLDTGVIPARECDADGCKAYASPTHLVPLIEGDPFYAYGVETMSSGLANEASKLGRDRFGIAPSNHALLVSVHGRSGNTYLCLRKGGCERKGRAAGYLPAFDDAMMAVADAMALARGAGKTYVVRAVTAIHGESDHDGYATNTQEFPMPATSGRGVIANYAEAMVEWQKDYEASVRALTGQSIPVPLLLLQMSNWNDVEHTPIPTWQLAAHVSAPRKVVVVTPGYPMGDSSDCLHFTNHAERRIGEYFGKAYARVVLEGKPWEPLRPRSVTLLGNVVTARFVVPRPPLVLDTQRVKDPGNYGFELFDDSGAPPAITRVALASADTVTVTLASAPTGTNTRLRYAFTATPLTCPGPETGARGNLRDSDDTPSVYGYDLFNWSVHFDEPVK